MTDQDEKGPDWSYLTPDQARAMLANAERLDCESQVVA
jgi:hypothetical protein